MTEGPTVKELDWKDKIRLIGIMLCYPELAIILLYIKIEGWVKND